VKVAEERLRGCGAVVASAHSRRRYAVRTATHRFDERRKRGLHAHNKLRKVLLNKTKQIDWRYAAEARFVDSRRMLP
jgi:hypothetical protein